MTERIHSDDDATTPLPPPDGPPTFGASSGYVARVNLLPAEIVRQRRWRQIGLASVGVLAVYVVALAAFYVVKTSEAADALQERTTAERRVAMLQAEVEELSQYQTLVDDIDARETLLTTAMDEELSWARVFGDLALAFSRDASLTQVDAAATVEEPQDGQIVPPTDTQDATDTQDGAAEQSSEVPEPEPDVAELDVDDSEPVAQVVFTGYSIKEFAPGVAEVLANFAEAEGFFDSFLTTAVDEERGDSEVTTFEGRVELDDRAYTRRYDDGLPETGIQ